MKYVAFLRGINVGGKNKVEMARLKSMLERLGYKDVQTYINSGNVIFVSDSSDQVEMTHKIEQGIHDEFNLTITVVVRSADNPKDVLAACDSDWQNNEDEKTNIMFLLPKVDSPDVINGLDATSKDTIKYIKGAIIWRTSNADFNKSGLSKLAKNPIYKQMTVRNINTLRKVSQVLQM